MIAYGIILTLIIASMSSYYTIFVVLDELSKKHAILITEMISLTIKRVYNSAHGHVEILNVHVPNSYLIKIEGSKIIVLRGKEIVHTISLNIRVRANMTITFIRKLIISKVREEVQVIG